MAFSDLAITNMAVSLLAGSVNDSSDPVTFSVESGDGNLKFPATAGGKHFKIVVQKASGAYEIMKVTARTNDALTADRAQEGTSMLTFSAGDAVSMRITAGDFDDLIAELEGKADAADPVFTGDVDLSGATVTLAGATIDILPAGLRMQMFQPTIPAGWSLVAAWNESIPINRSTNTVAGQTGGSWTISGLTVAGTTLTAAQSGLPAHTVPVPWGSNDSIGSLRNGAGGPTGVVNVSIAAQNAAASHTHGISSAGTWRPPYFLGYVAEKA